MKYLMIFLVFTLSLARADELPPVGNRITNEKLPSVKEALRYGLSTLSDTICLQQWGDKKISFDLQDITLFSFSRSVIQEYFEGLEAETSIIYKRKIKTSPEIYYYFINTDESGVFVKDVNWEIYTFKTIRVNQGTIRNPDMVEKEVAVKLASGNCFSGPI